MSVNYKDKDYDCDLCYYGNYTNKNCPSGAEAIEKGEHFSCFTPLYESIPIEPPEDVREYNVGSSDYSTRKIQPWDIWLEYNLNPWDADIIKRVLRTKEGESRVLDYEKIIHVAKERIRQLNT